ILKRTHQPKTTQGISRASDTALLSGAASAIFGGSGVPGSILLGKCSTPAGAINNLKVACAQDKERISWLWPCGGAEVECPFSRKYTSARTPHLAPQAEPSQTWQVISRSVVSGPASTLTT